MKTVVMIQDRVRNYRHEFYNLLALEYNLVVIHGGLMPCVKTPCTYTNIILARSKCCGFSYSHGLLKQVVRLSPDKIIVPFDLRNLSAWLVAFKSDKKRLISFGHRRSSRLWINCIKNRLADLFEAHLLYTKEDIGYFQDKGYLGKLISFNNSLPTFGLNDCSDTVKDSFLFIGRYQRRKGIDNLVVAFDKASETTSTNMKLILIGPGFDDFHFLELVRKCKNFRNIEILGPIHDHKKLQQFFQRSLAFVSPSHVGLGVVHSFAHGIPVVTYKNRKHAQEAYYLNSTNAYLLGDHEKLEDTLIDIINNQDVASLKGTKSLKFYKDHLVMENMLKQFQKALNF